MEVYDELRQRFTRLLSENHIESEAVTVTARALTIEEAIGNPEDKDYPLITGRERIMQAEVGKSYGHAFTDMFGNYSGKLIDIAQMELPNNYRRAIFIASLNAAMRHLGLVEKTVHCKDEDPKICGPKLAEYIKNKYGHPKIAMVGLQPRMVESLVKEFEIRVTDLDYANINSKKFGVTIQSPQNTESNMNWCDLIVSTGSTIVNGTITNFLVGKPVIFYGVTITGAAKLMGYETFCHCGR